MIPPKNANPPIHRVFRWMGGLLSQAWGCFRVPAR